MIKQEFKNFLLKIIEKCLPEETVIINKSSCVITVPTRLSVLKSSQKSTIVETKMFKFLILLTLLSVTLAEVRIFWFCSVFASLT